MRSPARSRRGFTLMEVVIAVSITAGIGLSLAIAINTTIKSKETMEQGAERYRMIRTAFSRMCREIGAAYISDRYSSLRYRDQYERPTNFVGAKDKLMFASMAHERLYSDAKESDQMIVEYSVKTNNDKDAKGRTDLMRREKTILEERPERGGTEDVLFEGVKKVEFQYWDSDMKQWQDEWDTRKLDRKSILPTRVKITVTALDENGKDQKYSTETRIMLNTELPRFQ